MADPWENDEMYWSSPAAFFVLAPQPHRYSGAEYPQGDEAKSGKLRLNKRNHDQTKEQFVQ